MVLLPAGDGRRHSFPQRPRRGPTPPPCAPLLARLHLPDGALPGSLAISRRRCGKPSCHCADGEGHPLWTLTLMAGGKKRVDTIPADWIDAVRPRAEAGRHFKVTAAELLRIDAELLVLARKQRTRPSRPPISSPP